MAPGRKQTNHGKLSDKTRKILEESLGGMDPEEWKEKMKALREVHQESNVNQRKKRSDDEAGKDHFYESEAVQKTEGILDVNEKSGVLDYLYQGDILLTESQLNTLISESEQEGARNKRQISSFASKWTNNTVYYHFENGFNANTNKLVKYALTYLQSVTCLKFVESSTASNRIEIVEAGGCFSKLGMMNYADQSLSLPTGCDYFGTVVHEFLHALGFIHTQMRFDRDNFLTINENAIDSNKLGNFVKYSQLTNLNVVDYEYGSVMHYAADAFSSPQVSMIPKDESMLYTMGSQLVSFLDIKSLNQFYSCSCPNTLSCKNGGYMNPSSCNSCICPAGYGGKLCDTREDTKCGAILEATKNWTTIKYELGGAKKDVVHQQQICNHLITAPSDATIEIRLEYGSLQYCYYGCVWSGIEPKVNLDQLNTSPRYCCPEFKSKILVSQVNPLPVVSWTALDWTIEHSFSYRYVINPTTTTKPASTTTTTVTPTPVTSAQSTTTKVLNRCSVDLGL